MTHIRIDTSKKLEKIRKAVIALYADRADVLDKEKIDRVITDLALCQVDCLVDYTKVKTNF